MPYLHLHGRNRGLAARAAGLALLLALAGVAPAAAQIGAFGGAPSTLPSGDQAAPHAVPIFTESAVFSPAGTLGGTVMLGLTRGSIAAPGGDLDYGMTQTAGSFHYSLSDRAVVGASLQPWTRVSLSQAGASVSESGQGDAAIHGKYRLWESDDRRTAAAIAGTLGLPLGSEGFGAQGVMVAMDLAASRQLEGASLHGSVGITLPTDELDGESVVRFSGGGMYRLSDQFAVGAELLTQFSNGEYIADLAPGLRFQGPSGIIIDAAFLVNAGTSLPEIYDGGFLVAVRVGG